MDDTIPDIIVFGEGGQWLAKNKTNIERRFKNPHYIGVGDWKHHAATTKAPVALIMSPPDTHLEICQHLLKNSAVQTIYCEKPFPDIHRLSDMVGDTDDIEAIKDKIRVIDHYLLKNTQPHYTDIDIYLDRYRLWHRVEIYVKKIISRLGFGRNKVWRLSQRYMGRWYFKPGAYNPLTSNSFAKGIWQNITHFLIYVITALFRLLSFVTGSIPVKYIEINLKEKETEDRPWMKEGDNYGGVTYDLAHHALAILLRIFGEKALQKVTGKDITIRKVKFFDPANKKAISEISFLIEIARCTVRINVAKDSTNTSKKVSLYKKFMTHAKPNQEYSLTESVQSGKGAGYDYGEIFSKNPEKFNNEAACLSYSETKTLNRICDRVIDLAHNVKKKEVDPPKDKMELINNLTDQFKHRHSFYWQSYYKLVIYQVIILLTPYAFAINLGNSGEGPALTILGLTLIISCWIYYWGVQRVSAVLSEEHIRMKVVHDRLKDLLNTTKIDLSVISINESSISDVMQIQYRFLIRGFCILNPLIIYFMHQDHIMGENKLLPSFLKSLF